MSSDATAPIDAIAARVLRISALATLVMVALSWPLWVEPSVIPRVPFIRTMPQSSAVASWILFAGLIIGLAATALSQRPSGWALLCVAVIAVLVLQDQHRFQPWLYQFAVLAAITSTLAKRDVLRYFQWWFVSLYFYSGLSKLDRSFADELGLLFLATAVRPLGLHPAEWPAAGESSRFWRCRFMRSLSRRSCWCRRRDASAAWERCRFISF